MNYKFYIYKQNRPDLIFDKYDLNDYILLREITQNGQWGLKIERDKEFYTVIRRHFNGEVVVKGTDFDTLIALERDTEQYAVVIHRECSGVWSEFWKGYFSYFDFKPDLDRCYLTFEPEVWDEYSPVYDQMPIERNVLVADIDHSAFLGIFEWPSESVNNDYVLIGGFAPAGWIEFTGLPAGNSYYMTSVESIFTGSDPLLLNIYNVHEVYTRDYAITNDGVNPPSLDPLWQLDPTLTGPGVYNLELGQYKWVKPYLSITAGTVVYTHTINDKDHLFTIVTTSATVATLYGLKYLNKILEYYADLMGLTYVSDFLNDIPNPLGQRTMRYTVIQQISNLRAYGEQATKGMMTLKWLLTQIKNTFNAYWCIDSNGDFRIEHKKYFEWGLSYTAIAGIIMDLGVLYPDNILKLRRYEWSKPSLTRFEKMDIVYSALTDWIDASIEYPQLSIRGNETVSNTVEWGTDINNMYTGREELPTEGWVLLDIVPGAVVNMAGALTGAMVANNRFSAANLFRDFFSWGRLLPTGKVNGTNTTFDSIDRLKKQVELSLPQCCDEIDYNGIFRTPLGDGLLDAAEYESKSGNLKVQLIYE